MSQFRASHGRAVAQCLLVTFLWSTSFVLIKLGLRGTLPPLTFAGLRYFLAFLCLAPLVVFSRERKRSLRSLGGRQWSLIVLLGLAYYALSQGLQFLGLSLLPAASVSLILNCTPLAVAFFGHAATGEKTRSLQWLGVALSLAGAGVYFGPLSFGEGAWLGAVWCLLSMLCNAGSALLGRRINRDSAVDAVTLTFVSMGLGSIPLLLTGLFLQGLGSPGPDELLLVFWLAVVNTAWAFTLWNKALRVLSAVEASVLNGTMLPQIAALAWVFLGEALDIRKCAGLAISLGGAFLVQRHGASKR